MEPWEPADMSGENLLDHNQLTAYVDILDVAETAIAGEPFIAMAMLTKALDKDPINTLSVLTGFVAATVMTLAQVAGVEPSQMAAQLRANGSL